MNIQAQFGQRRGARAPRRADRTGRHDPQGACAATCRTSFAPLLFAARRAGGPARATRPRELAELAEAAWQFLAQRKPGAPKIRFESRAGPIGAERISTVSVIEIVNDDMPFLLDSVHGRADRARRRRPPRAASDLRGGARPDRRARRASAARRPAAGAARARASSRSMSSASRTRRARPRSLEALGAGARRRARRACRTGGRCSARVGEVIADLKTNPPPLPVDEIAEAIAVPGMAGRRQFHLPRRARVRAHRRRATTRADPVREPGSASCATRTCGCCAAAASWSRSRREIADFLKEPQAADHHQGQRALARAPPRATWTMSASSASTPTAS